MLLLRYCKIVVLSPPFPELAGALSPEARRWLADERQAASSASYVNLIKNCGATPPTG
jgi:hypothetical protein